VGVVLTAIVTLSVARANRASAAREADANREAAALEAQADRQAADKQSGLNRAHDRVMAADERLSARRMEAYVDAYEALSLLLRIARDAPTKDSPDSSWREGASGARRDNLRSRLSILGSGDIAATFSDAWNVLQAAADYRVEAARLVEGIDKEGLAESIREARIDYWGRNSDKAADGAKAGEQLLGEFVAQAQRDLETVSKPVPSPEVGEVIAPARTGRVGRREPK
jgi:hypothetical protein